MKVRGYTDQPSLVREWLVEGKGRSDAGSTDFKSLSRIRAHQNVSKEAISSSIAEYFIRQIIGLARKKGKDENGLHPLCAVVVKSKKATSKHALRKEDIRPTRVKTFSVEVPSNGSDLYYRPSISPYSSFIRLCTR